MLLPCLQEPKYMSQLELKSWHQPVNQEKNESTLERRIYELLTPFLLYKGLLLNVILL